MASPTDILEIDSAKLKRMLMLHVRFILLDVRALDDYSEGHINGALHLSPETFVQKLGQMVPQKDMPIVIYGEDGADGAKLVVAAENQGYLNVVNLEGGYRAYQSHP